MRNVIQLVDTTPDEDKDIKLIDLLQGKTYGCSIHQHGFIRLIDCMPRLVPEGQTGDLAVVRAARVSYGRGTKKVSDDESLIRYLMRHDHSTPLEMVTMTFHIRMPIFVARQLIRHRTLSVNEVSARYSILPDLFYVPADADIKAQSKDNKQGRAGLLPEELRSQFKSWLIKSSGDSYEKYLDFVEAGVAKELARTGLPLNIYTDWYFETDLRNALHLLQLRMDPHAQQEIRDYANPMFELVRLVAPMSCKAFEDYTLNSLTFTALEIEALQKGHTTLLVGSQREQDEFAAKLEKIGRKSAKSGSD